VSPALLQRTKASVRRSAVAVTYVQGLQNSPRRAPRVHRTLLRLYSVQLPQMNVPVLADEGTAQKTERHRYRNSR